MKFVLLCLFLLVSCSDKNKRDIQVGAAQIKEGYELLKKMEAAENTQADLELNVLGRQWDWIFTYPDGNQISGHWSKKVSNGDLTWSPLHFDTSLKGEEMEKQLAKFVTVPINKKIRLLMTAEKVNHALAIPAFRIKKDLTPGKTSAILFTPVKEGTYIYTCNEMCGIDHGAMVGYIRVVSEEEYKAFTKALKKLQPKVKIPKDKSPVRATR